jgi:hypothetical protein
MGRRDGVGCTVIDDGDLKLNIIIFIEEQSSVEQVM